MISVADERVTLSAWNPLDLAVLDRLLFKNWLWHLWLNWNVSGNKRNIAIDLECYSFFLLLFLILIVWLFIIIAIIAWITAYFIFLGCCSFSDINFPTNTNRWAAANKFKFIAFFKYIILKFLWFTFGINGDFCLSLWAMMNFNFMMGKIKCLLQNYRIWVFFVHLILHS